MSMISCASGLRNGSWRYASESGESASALASSGSLLLIRRSESSISRSWCSSGTPRMCPSTRIGIGAAMSSTKSNSPFGSASSSTRSVSPRSHSSQRPTARGVKSGASTLRQRACRGGSSSSMLRRTSSSSGEGSSSVMPRASLENVAVSLRMRRMSS